MVRKGVLAAVAAVLVIGGTSTGVALASSSATTTTTPGPNVTAYGCDTGSSRTLTGVYTNPANFKPCKDGFAVTIGGKTGAAGVGVKSATVNSSGDLVLTFTNGTTVDAGHVVGPQGQPGTNGTNGTSAVSTVTGSLSLDDHGDSSNYGEWATDDLTVNMTLTNNGPVSVSHCDDESAPATCYFYTATIQRTGTFTTLTSFKSPATGKPVTLTPAVGLTGNVSGSATVEFYYSKDDASAANLPATINEEAAAYNSPQGVAYTLQGFFPDADLTVPGAITLPLSHLDVTSYQWEYGPTASTCETWIDSSANADGSTGDYGTDIAAVDQCSQSSS